MKSLTLTCKYIHTYLYEGDIINKYQFDIVSFMEMFNDGRYIAYAILINNWDIIY